MERKFLGRHFSSLRSLAVFNQFERAKEAVKPRKRAPKPRGAWERDNFAALCARAKNCLKNCLNRQDTQPNISENLVITCELVLFFKEILGKNSGITSGAVNRGKMLFHSFLDISRNATAIFGLKGTASRIYYRALVIYKAKQGLQ